MTVREEFLRDDFGSYFLNSFIVGALNVKKGRSWLEKALPGITVSLSTSPMS